MAKKRHVFYELGIKNAEQQPVDCPAFITELSLVVEKHFGKKDVFIVWKREHEVG